MKIKIIYLILLLIFIPAYAVYAEKQSFDFRNTNWGMSQEQVIKSEDDPMMDQNNKTLFYYSSLAGMPCNLYYSFKQNQLINAGYEFDVSSDNQQYITDSFMLLKNLLIQKYGKSKSYQDNQLQSEKWETNNNYSFNLLYFIK